MTNMPIWAYIPAVVIAGMIAFLTLCILVKTNLKDWMIILITTCSFVVYALSVSYITFIILY